MTVELTREPLDVAEVERRATLPDCGATLLFVGRVRDHHHGRVVLRLEYDAYEPMALAKMREIENLLRDRWPIRRVAIAHRLGILEVGDASIVIAISLAHRREGFEALRFAIDHFKEVVPIWKKEHFADGESRWVEGS